MPNYEPRVRFNWGFHDGTCDAQWSSERDVSNHFDFVYAEGYRAGIKAFSDTGVRPESSDSAWEDWKLRRPSFGFVPDSSRAHPTKGPFSVEEMSEFVRGILVELEYRAAHSPINEERESAARAITFAQTLSLELRDLGEAERKD